MNTFEPVTQKAAKAVKWSALLEIVSRTASPIMFVILARLLTPEDFGVVSIAMIAISFSQMFWDAGLEKALIQIKEVPEKAAEVVFWTNLVLGIVTYVALFLIAPWLATFFNSPASMPVLRVLGLQIVIASLTSVQQALFVRGLDFRQLFWMKLATAFVPGFFSIPMAFFGYGVWALVAGSLVGSLLNLALLWWLSPWRPHLSYDWCLARMLLSFGVWVVGESFMAWFFGWGDSLLVGKFLGVDELGTYRVGWNILTVIFGLLISSFTPVLYPVFSRLQDDVLALKSAFHKVIRITSAISLPAGTGLLVTGPLLASGFFGEKWHGLGLILGLIGFMHGFMGFFAVNPELYRAMGRPDVNAKLQFAFVLIYLPVYLVTCPLGLKVFVFARMGLGFVTVFIHIYLSVRLLGMSPFYMWYDSKSTILAAASMGIALMGLRWLLTSITRQLPEVVMLGVLVIAGTVVYIAMLWLLDRSFVLKTKDRVIRAVFT